MVAQRYETSSCCWANRMTCSAVEGIVFCGRHESRCHENCQIQGQIDISLSQ